MKKWISMTLLMFVGVLIFGCENGISEKEDNAQNETFTVTFESLMEKLENDNFTMIYETSTKDLSMALIKRLDGNNYYQSSDWGFMRFEIYSIEENGTKYAYSRFAGSEVWQKGYYYDAGDTWLFDTLYAMFDIDQSWLEEESLGVYHLKDAYFEEVFEEDADEFESLIYTLTSDSITFTATGKADSDIHTFIFAFTDIGNTEVGFPEGEIEDNTGGSFDPGNGDDNDEGRVITKIELISEGVLEQGEINEYTITIEEAGDYLIWLESDEALSLELRKDGNFLSASSGVNPIIERTLEPGDYVIYVDDWEGVRYGPYQLFIGLIED
ncbi:hypothetical protein [Liberiplasma polymorphum]|uniref:hypothetical protein n=1 Tax=Liberiplasma polymorphum TaxID=3374570 RepID=UPI003773ABF6